MSELLAVVYLICFAVIAGGAFALMSQNLRGSVQLAPSQRSNSWRRRHPKAPGPGEEVLLYVNLSRERLEELYQQASQVTSKSAH